MGLLDYLGKGEKFPLQPTISNAVALVDGEDLIKQSIFDILSTSLGTHFPNEEYGSDLFQLTFGPNDIRFESLVNFMISEALFNWEKRIQVTSIDTYLDNENKVNCLIKYMILASNEVDSFVFPYYKIIVT